MSKLAAGGVLRRNALDGQRRKGSGRGVEAAGALVARQEEESDVRVAAAAGTKD